MRFLSGSNGPHHNFMDVQDKPVIVKLFNGSGTMLRVLESLGPAADSKMYILIVFSHRALVLCGSISDPARTSSSVL
jgi:hypothetical protein